MEVTLEITNKCPYECDYCSSNAIPSGKHLPKSEAIKFLKNLPLDKIDRINISGGEPLSHPDFYEILQFCWSITKNVWVYTNALTKIIYNADVLDEIEIEANIVPIAGREIRIPENVSRVHLLKLIHQGRAKNLPKQNITISRNFYSGCEDCNHVLLQADGKVVKAPCKKTYG